MGCIITESSIISNDESLAKNKKEEEYLNYINEHRNNVKIAFNNLFISRINEFESLNSNLFTFDELKSAVEELSKERIENHDLSKYSEEEFEPYRAKYYATEKELSGLTDEDKQLIDNNADIAYEHHYKNNPHHPKYWIDDKTKKPTDMDILSIVEMICDWEAMSIKFGSSTLDWYNNKADEEKKDMTNNTKNIVELLLNKLFNN